MQAIADMLLKEPSNLVTNNNNINSVIEMGAMDKMG